MLIRLFTAPMSAADFIIGYMLPLFPMAVVQSIVCFGTAMLLGLEPSVNIVYAILLLLPSALFFIALGVLCGTLFSEKAVGGLCGALLTNLTAFTSGAWFDLSFVGGVFKKICELLPFAHSVYIGRNALSGDFAEIFPDMYYVLGYMLAAMIFAVALFTRKMKEA